MNYTCKVEIDLPIEAVIEKFDNVENLKHWQPGLVSFDHLSGVAGKIGAKSKIIYVMGRRRIEMIEAITKVDFPHSFNATYEANNVYNEVENSFVSSEGNKTQWESVNFFRFKGMMSILSFFLSGAFKKQSMKYMINFKNFAETGKSVLK